MPNSKRGKLIGYVPIALTLLVLAVVLSCHDSRKPASPRGRHAGKDLPALLVRSLTKSQLACLRDQHLLYYRDLDYSQQAVMDEIVKTALPGDNRLHRNKPYDWMLEYEQGLPPTIWFTAPIWVNGMDHMLYFVGVPDLTAWWYPRLLVPLRRPPITAGVQY